MEGEELKRIPLRQNLLGQGLIVVTVALMGLGVVMAFSTAAARAAPSRWYYRLDVRQAVFAAAGFLILVTLWRMDYRWLARRACEGGRVLKWLLSPAAALLLIGVAGAVVVLVLGRRVHGSARWFRYGPVGFQPSGVLTFALLIYLAALLAWLGPRVRSFWACFVPASLLLAAGCGLIISQDFGTAAIAAAAALALMLMGGVRAWNFLLVPPAVAAAYYRFVHLVAYRRTRIDVWFMPFSTTHPSAYQSQQSAIAIATGARPAGIGGGPAKYGYLPEAQPDFIFSIICQEAGLLGAVLVIALLGAWLYLVWRIATRAADRFGALLAGGLGALIGLQAVLHIAVTVWWAPPTGVPLGFISYGGTSLLTMAAATALIVSVSSRRPLQPH